MDFPISQPAIGLKNGQFVDENLVTGEQGSVIPASWANSLTNEVLNVIKGAGHEPDENTHNQMLHAINRLIGVGLQGYGRFYTVAQAKALTSDIGPIMVIGMPHPWYWVQNSYFSGYRSPMSGLFCWGATNQPLAHEIDAIGQVITESDCGGLIARFRESGLVVSSGAWKPGEFKIADLGGGQWKAPDMRDMFIRATGTDVDTANARTVGSTQSDAIRNITGYFNQRVYTSEEYLVGHNRGGVFGASREEGAATVPNPTGPAKQRSRLTFDASNVVPTSSENRPINTALSPRIYR